MEEDIKNLHPELHWAYIESVILAANDARRQYAATGNVVNVSTYFSCLKHIISEIKSYQVKCSAWNIPIGIESQRELKKAISIYDTASKRAAR